MLLAGATALAQPPADRAGASEIREGRLTAIAYPPDTAMARALLANAARRDTFPGLPRPRAPVRIEFAPDEARFREWAGRGAPEWGVAVAFPRESRIVMHGVARGDADGNPLEILRHELAHVALSEGLGFLPPRWFDEGYASYAAGEWGREEVLATSVALLIRGVPTLDSLDAGFREGRDRASSAYALAYTAVSDLAARDRTRGLRLLFAYWRESGSLDAGVRRAYGITLGGFEADWRARTRRKYGAVALLADAAVFGVATIVLLLPLHLMRRRRYRVRLAALRAREITADRRVDEGVLRALLDGGS